MSDDACRAQTATERTRRPRVARSIGRRRFLSVLGGSGLTAAGALFGSAGRAEAAGGCGCCNLVYCPANTSIGSCQSVSHYLWGCSVTGSLHCSCCEKKRANGSYSASAYSCQYN